MDYAKIVSGTATRNYDVPSGISPILKPEGPHVFATDREGIQSTFNLDLQEAPEHLRLTIFPRALSLAGTIIDIEIYINGHLVAERASLCAWSPPPGSSELYPSTTTIPCRLERSDWELAPGCSPSFLNLHGSNTVEIRPRFDSSARFGIQSLHMEPFSYPPRDRDAPHGILFG